MFNGSTRLRLANGLHVTFPKLMNGLHPVCLWPFPKIFGFSKKQQLLGNGWKGVLTFFFSLRRRKTIGFDYSVYSISFNAFIPLGNLPV